MDGTRHPLRIGFPAAASLSINALLIVALLNLGMAQRPRKIASPSLTILSLAVPKGIEAGEEEASATTPATATSQDLAPPRVQEPVLAPVPPLLPFTAPRPLAMAAAPAQPETQPITASPASSAAPAASMSPSPASAPARRGKADGLDAQAPAGTSYAYAARVRSWLYAHKIYPRRARMRREEGVVKVRFVIDRAGQLLEGAIIASSGEVSLDQEASAMLQRSSPFPQAPNDIRGDRIEFTAPIEFVLPV